MRICRFAFAAALAVASAAFASPTADGPDVHDTRLLSEPAISAERLAFIYAGDLWTSSLDGRNVKRLTADVGAESSPAFSPDGKWIAFSAHYEGNLDVYVVAAEGGVPRRLTWHPGTDIVQGFTPDGSAVLFSSARAVHTTRYRQLYTVPVGGGPETQLPIPNADRGSYSADGRYIAYNPVGPAFRQWKRYRGGTVSRVWIFDTQTSQIERIPQPPGRANDWAPMWLGDTVYFLSDREGEFNLWSYDRKTKALARRTDHSDFPIVNASAGAGKIAYEQAGYIHLYDPARRETAGSPVHVPIGVAADLQELRPRFVKGPKYVRSASISPSGARVAFEFRGEILSVPADKGDVRNLTNTTAAHERGPIWSPDGRRIAYFSDESGEYELVVRSQDGKGAPAKYKLSGTGFYDRAAWSPDSRKIAYTDNGWSVYWLDLATGVSKKVGSEYLYGPQKTIWPAWSPDSRWLVYTLANHAYIQTVYAYSLEQDKAFAVTDGLSDVSEPAFDRSGKYLYFFASTNAGPVRNWFSQENEDSQVTRSIYMAVLRKDLPNPLQKESDEEKLTPEARTEKEKDSKNKDKKGVEAAGQVSDEPEKSAPAAKADEKEKPGEEKPRKPPVADRVTIDREGLEFRILDLPVPASQLSNLQPGPAGQIFYLREVDGKKALTRFDLKERKAETLLSEVDGYELSADGKKVLWKSKDMWAIGGAGGKTIPASEGKLKLDALEVRIDPRAEWPAIFHEAWRINRDYFYDPHMHGVDWNAMREKYAAFLPHLAVRDDLNRVIQWMCSELSVGHHRGGGGDPFSEPKDVPGGLLGADYAVENGRYRFRKVYGGLNWNPELRAPLTEPGVNVKAGEYLIAVGGRDVKPPANLYGFFENTSGKLTEITVGPNADGSGSRTVTVVPIASEVALRNRDWVEGNIRKVDAATNGRVAYVYVPNTGSSGHASFKRYFFPQAYKDAVILDERYNGGGSVADYYIDQLAKPLIAYWAMRYGADMKTPSASIQGPRVMIIDENAGSGGDLLPWMWRKFKMGPIVGQRTWGGLVGILGFPVLMDGGTITAPNLAIWDAEKGWIVENEGVPPDIEVEQTPADLIAGRDPQLDRAIAIALDELKKNPPSAPKRPPYPDKTGRAGTVRSGSGS